MRLRNLDILRGIAVLLVLGRHMDPLADSAGAAGRLADIWYQSGWIGVDLFFALSGPTALPTRVRPFARGLPTAAPPA